MKVSVVGADTTLGALLCSRLAGEHEVRAFACSRRGDGSSEPRPVDLRTEADARLVCHEADAVLHLGALAHSGLMEGDAPSGADVSSGGDPVDRLDEVARGTYNLCDAAREAGVGKIVLASSLRLFDPYEPDLLIDEWWRPLPRTDVSTQAIYAAEEVARQHCLAGGVRCVALRFLPLGEDGTRETRPADAASAIERALELEPEVPGYRWQVFHIATSSRFITRNARETLGWEASNG